MSSVKLRECTKVEREGERAGPNTKISQGVRTGPGRDSMKGQDEKDYLPLLLQLHNPEAPASCFLCELSAAATTK